MTNYTASPFAEMQAAVHGQTQQELPYPYHTSQITAEQAEAANAAFDFKIVGGTHGSVHGWARGTVSLSSPTDVEYQAAADAVAELDASRGDRLFVEGPGMDGEPLVPATMLAKSPAQLRDYAERGREERTIDAFKYAGVLAVSYGIAAVRADISAGMARAYTQAVGRPNLMAIAKEGKQGYTETMHLRNEQATYAVKDDALARLQQGTVDASPQDGLKPVSMLLFGEVHVDGEESGVPLIPQVYARIGLHASTSILPNSQEARKAAMEMPPLPDMTGMDPGQVVVTTMSYVAQAMKNFISL
jgi:hypothetical protein